MRMALGQRKRRWKGRSISERRGCLYQVLRMKVACDGTCERVLRQVQNADGGVDRGSGKGGGDGTGGRVLVRKCLGAQVQLALS